MRAIKVVVCPQCGNRLGVEFYKKRCPNPECTYIFGSKGVEVGHGRLVDVRILRGAKKGYYSATLTAQEIKKSFGLSKDEINNLTCDTRYGKKRYFKDEVAIAAKGKIKDNLAQRRLL